VNVVKMSTIRATSLGRPRSKRSWVGQRRLLFDPPLVASDGSALSRRSPGLSEIDADPPRHRRTDIAAGK
jgi:hypothetical protein